MSAGEIIKCPDILETKRIFVERNTTITSGRTTRKFDISLGQLESIDLYGFSVELEYSIATPTINTFAQGMVGLSYLLINDLEDQGTQSREIRWNQRTDLITDFYFVTEAIMTAVGTWRQGQRKTIWYNPHKCLVRAPVLDINWLVNSNNELILRVMAEIYYIKKGVVRSVLSQLLKVYNDAKAIYRQV